MPRAQIKDEKTYQALLLSEPVVMRQRHLDLARLDRGHLDAERAHHLLAVEAGPHPGQHLLGRLG